MKDLQNNTDYSQDTLFDGTPIDDTPTPARGIIRPRGPVTESLAARILGITDPGRNKEVPVNGDIINIPLLIRSLDILSWQDDRSRKLLISILLDISVSKKDRRNRSRHQDNRLDETSYMLSPLDKINISNEIENMSNEHDKNIARDLLPDLTDFSTEIAEELSDVNLTPEQWTRAEQLVDTGVHNYDGAIRQVLSK
ncbi:hypothetical protein FWG95_00275 [Candidatus Saccharibacteria bacterium]|nr:hypothetical protein [Candidatus Saccharibacteria bacterium]